MTASLLFCVGSLTVVGSIQDGLTGDYSCSRPRRCSTASRPIALVRHARLGRRARGRHDAASSRAGITLGAGLFDDMLVGEALAALTSAGGVMIIGISLKLLDIKDVKVGNFLPALVIAPALVGIVGAAARASRGSRRLGRRAPPKPGVRTSLIGANGEVRST